MRGRVRSARQEYGSRRADCTRELVAYKYEPSFLISPETFRFTVAEMLTGNFEVRPDDDQDTPSDPGAIFYFTFAERKEFAALDFLEGPVALALDSALVSRASDARVHGVGRCGRSERCSECRTC